MPEPVPIADGAGLAFAALKGFRADAPNECRWPLWGFAGPAPGGTGCVCGAATPAGRVYCPGHAALAYVPASPRAAHAGRLRHAERLTDASISRRKRDGSYR